jgi:hypothetical protein
MRKEIEDVSQDLDGFEDLRPEDQESVLAAFAQGHLRDEDMTLSLHEKEEAHAENTSEAQAVPNVKVSVKAETKTDPPPKGVKRGARTLAGDEDDDEFEKPEFVDDLPAKRTRRRPAKYDPTPTTLSKSKDEDEDEDEEEDEDEDEDEDEGEDSDNFEEDGDEDDEDDD